MRKCFLTYYLMLLSLVMTAQGIPEDISDGNGGRIFISMGWNVGWFTNSNIRFRSDDYDFTLENVKATDRQSPFGLDPYFHPGKFTIPQTNYRIGYYLNNRWNISFGVDHMKYVLQNGQTVNIKGQISAGDEKYDGVYDQEIILAEDFLKFEHTDGLNYINVELRHIDKMIDHNFLQVSLVEGGGIGILFPRTRTEFLGNLNRDAYKVSGYGIAPFVGLNITFYKWFFIQSEFKGGYINMPSIKIASTENAKASQSFFFTQWNYSFGFSRKF